MDRMLRSITLLLVLAALATPAAAHADFYAPPTHVPAKHGELIRSKTLTGAAAPAPRTELLLYSSKGVAGKPVAVSGTITYPKGKAPKGGWPVVTWAHGTTGIADQCAPSRLTSSGDPDLTGLVTYAYPLFRRWLKAGWAVARTDYEGLGTPGVHPYLIGTSEGRATLDVALAAPKVNRKRVIISGHSQGGHAALWANSLAPSYASKLTIRGTVAFAPESHTGEQAQAISALTTPSGLTGLAAMILRGAEVQTPSLDIVSLLNPQPAALYPKVDTDCLPGLTAPDAYGSIAPSDLIKPDADKTAVIAALNANDTEDLAIHGKLRVEQGDADTTVFPAFTDQTVAGYKDKGVSVDYDKVPGVTHGGIVTTAAVQKAATKWIAKRLR